MHHWYLYQSRSQQKMIGTLILENWGNFNEEIVYNGMGWLLEKTTENSFTPRLITISHFDIAVITANITLWPKETTWGNDLNIESGARTFGRRMYQIGINRKETGGEYSQTSLISGPLMESIQSHYMLQKKYEKETDKSRR